MGGSGDTGVVGSGVEIGIGSGLDGTVGVTIDSVVVGAGSGLDGGGVGAGSMIGALVVTGEGGGGSVFGVEAGIDVKAEDSVVEAWLSGRSSADAGRVNEEVSSKKTAKLAAERRQRCCIGLG